MVLEGVHLVPGMIQSQLAPEELRLSGRLDGFARILAELVAPR